jgi:hypothetical protein
MREMSHAVVLAGDEYKENIRKLKVFCRDLNIHIIAENVSSHSLVWVV